LEHLISLGWNARLQTELSSSDELQHLSLARIVAVDRGSYLASFGAFDQHHQRVSLSGRLRHEGVEIAVGDWVGLQESRIDHLFSRQSKFVRKQAGLSSREQVIATNVDLTIVAMSLNEDFSLNRVERYLLAAWDAGTTPLVVLTKADLVSIEEAESARRDVEQISAGCETLVLSAVSGEGVEQLKARLPAGKTAVLVGSSGVGKSSLVNALLQTEQQAVAEIREADAKGRHTTTRRELLHIPDTGGLIIDTPGMREFGVMRSDSALAEESQSFADIEQLATMCAFRDCQHSTEPGCAIEAAIAEGTLQASRMASYQKLMRELAYNERRASYHKEREERKVWKQRTIEYRRRAKSSAKHQT
jgi:ribosome biogenesis GTPase